MSIFDGMAGVLGGIFGDAVTWTPAGGTATAIRGIFREVPVEIAAEDGSAVLAVQPMLKVQRPAADAIKTDDAVAPGNGRTYRIAARHPSGSPAADAFVDFTLESLT